MNEDYVFEKLFNHFKVSTIRDLSEKINMSESTVSKWRQRESINAIKKKCRELGIYKEIFSNTHIIKQEDFFIDIMSYSNINMKKIIKFWGVQGYGITVGIILYLKENDTLNLTDIDLLADDLKTSTFLIKKVIEDCELFKIDDNIIELNIEL